MTMPFYLGFSFFPICENLRHLRAVPDSVAAGRAVKPNFSHHPRRRTLAFFAALGSCCAGCWLQAAGDPAITPRAVLNSMEQVADWQFANPGVHGRTDWTSAAGDAGFMALAGISGNPKYREAMLAVGETNQWQPGARMYHADDQCIGQTYAELYLLYREPRMIKPLRERFDAILAKPTAVRSLDFGNPNATENWSWCDALFMAPPAWMRLYAATDDERYMSFAVTNWWRTADYLYDKEERLFFRDSTYFQKREANGKKIFWSRGNGWVMAGLVRVLQYLPMNHPDRPRFEGMFKEMAAKILTCQQADGLWRASLLDPASCPQKETSGSGFYTYALAWGVNQGLLDRAAFQPAVEKAWNALNGCVEPDGKLTHVQPVGAAPGSFPETSTDIFGVGAYLLAGSEVYRMEVLGQHLNPLFVVVRVTNPSSFRRDCETVELNDPEELPFYPRKGNPSVVGPFDLAVMDGASSRILASQFYSLVPGSEFHYKLVFQVDLAPGETRQYYIMEVQDLSATPQPLLKTFARYVPERYDDFAWESDRIAHRIYGQALIQAEGTITSGPDVWIKRHRNLIIDKIYKTKQYHVDNGDEMDDYRVGNGGAGCGGSCLWDGAKRYISSNYRNWKLITTGPIRSEFELTYDAWDADAAGRKVAMTERISIDANSYFSRMRTVFISADASPLTVAVGLAERPGREKATFDLQAGWVSYWQPVDGTKGTIGVAIILQPGSVTAFTNDNPNLPKSAFEPLTKPSVEGAPPIRNMLAVTRAEVGKPLDYYFGACWDRSGDFTNAVAWESYVRQFANCRAQPLVLAVAGKENPK
jgi:unsaturated rhamnogalacturonyl hydrolase